ncbi:hypothetical protein KP13_32195 [Klebsiella pneumoniae subsp. pneumoniae Kp13]|nr:hypothetical protein KP13_32195 [Klebsiella pneumoniae subsp. pneumoniae Kp13]
MLSISGQHAIEVTGDDRTAPEAPNYWRIFALRCLKLHRFFA